MDAFCFCKRSTLPEATQPKVKAIRVVHLDGYIEDYEGSTTIDQVTTVFPKHFMTTPVRLLQIGLVPLKPDTQLEPGRIYFLLPEAILRFNESSDNLISLTKKLTSVAKARGSMTKPVPLASHSMAKQAPLVTRPMDKPTALLTTRSLGKPPSASPQEKMSRKISLSKKLSNIAKTHGHVDPSSAPSSLSLGTQDKGSSDGSSNVENDMRPSRKRFSWRPRLSMIREISFTRRSESDLAD